MRILKIFCIMAISILLSACGKSDQFLVGEVTSIGNTCFVINCSGDDEYVEEFEVVSDLRIISNFKVGDRVRVWYEEEPEGSLPATVIAIAIDKLE